MKKAVSHLVPFMEEERLAMYRNYSAPDLYSVKFNVRSYCRYKANGIDPDKADDSDIYNGTVCG